MNTALGLLGIVVWIAAVIVIAAAVTWIIMKSFPGEKPGKPSADAVGDK